MSAAKEHLVSMTTDVWLKIKTKMLPTPAKFHYIFNLRDLSRVFQGILGCPGPRERAAGLGVADVIRTVGDLYALWQHESHRIFSDRLISYEDKAWCEAAILEELTNRLPEGDELKVLKAGGKYFVDFLRPGEEDPETGEELPAPKV